MPVRVLLREASPAAEMARQGMATDPQTLLDAGAEPVYGDLRDPPSLEVACRDVETVISTANATLRDGDFEAVDLNGTQSLVAAAKIAGVTQFVYLSALGANPDHPHPLYAAKGQCELDLKAGGMAYTILLPSLFTEIWVGAVVGIPLQARAPVTLVKPGTRPQAFVSFRDVAEYAVRFVGNPAVFDRSIPIGGEKSYSWNEVVAAVGRIVGQELPIDYVEPGDAVPLIPADMGPVLTGLELTGSVIDMAETSKTFGIEPTSLEVTLKQMFGGGEGM
ncbi:MAG TPA: NmrA family NAD(P)-binding protein, partial [Anaerolineales bacterium]|nr:NmrA family NAD(P)-binding protein [Anaerolineales bacterium]